MTQDRVLPQHSGRRRALVTGASSGIGMAFSERLARDGYDLIIVARRVGRLNTLARRLRRGHGATVKPLAVDLADPAKLQALEKVIAEDEALDLLVNNAAFGTAGPFAGLDINREEAEIRVNVVAPVRLTRAADVRGTAQGGPTFGDATLRRLFAPMVDRVLSSFGRLIATSSTERLMLRLRQAGLYPDLGEVARVQE